MKYEVSCGAVVFTQKDNEIYYVIIKSHEGFYGFPKGHMEENETEEETALREIAEETGLKVNILPGFRITDEYPLPKKEDTLKRVIYFIGKYEDQEIIYQKEELIGAYLMTYEEASKVLQFESNKRVLTIVNDYLYTVTRG
jgi:8-oxo-dGTP pyrophosphatase MutT (NUDIX family)